MTSVLFYTQFIRLQYQASPRIRSAFSNWAKYLDRVTTLKSCPPMIRETYLTCKSWIQKLRPATTTTTTTTTSFERSPEMDNTAHPTSDSSGNASNATHCATD